MANNKTEVMRILDKVKAEGRTSHTAPEGKLVCDAYGIPVPKEGVATSAAEAAKLASGMGFPVVLKIVSPEILHKTEAGGVLVGVTSAEDVQKGYDTIIANAKRYDAKATILGVQVQQMLGGGQEVIVGAVTDPSFGKLVAFGLGGVLVEVLKDITFRLAPATREDALSMLDGIAAAAMPSSIASAPSRVAGASRNVMSFSTSTSTPPRPNATSLPNDGSVTAPTITSWPPPSICWTCTPRMVAFAS